MSLTPLFFEHIPLELLFREGVKAADFNRFKQGRTLDRCHSDGTELLFSEIALNVCQQEKVDTKFNSLDTTTFTLTGDYLGRTDIAAVKINTAYKVLSRRFDVVEDGSKNSYAMPINSSDGYLMLG
jgi:hypothetical protein